MVKHIPVFIKNENIIYCFKHTKNGLITNYPKQPITMNTNKKKISLGFTSQQFEEGVHICQIFNDEDERHNTLIDFVVSGIASGEKTACFTEKENEKELSEFFEEKGFKYSELTANGEFALSKTAEVYFKDNKFDPERMLALLKEFYDNSKKENRNGARVIGEMTPDVEHVKDGSRLMEYESKVSLFVKKYPLNAVCQYDARAFDGATILDILKVHPLMIVRGNIVHNPFFEEPEEYLAKHHCK